MTRRLYVFDLDGTLADTAHLPEGRRTPSMLLDCDPLDTGLDTDRWANVNSRGVRVAGIPGFLEQLGHKVEIITRSPRPYASTLCGLLRMESMRVWPSTTSDRPTKLRRLAALAGVAIDDVIYVGDEQDDEDAADSVGCEFINVNDLSDTFDVAEDLPVLDGAPRSVAEAVWSLLNNPLDRREEMQEFLVANVRRWHRFCLVPAQDWDAKPGDPFRYVGVRPALFNEEDPRALYFAFLRKLFPALEAPELHPGVAENYYFVSYTTFRSTDPSDDPLGGLMRHIKQYRSASGKEVELGSLPFVAHVMAAHLSQSDTEHDRVLVDHVAPRPYSEEHPGQVSAWLCRWVTEAARTDSTIKWESRRTVSREGDVAVPPRGIWRRYERQRKVLLDDQRTRGRQLGQHIERSPLDYSLTMTWSFSQARHKTGPLPQHHRTRPNCFWPDEGDCPVHGPSVFAEPVPF